MVWESIRSSLSPNCSIALFVNANWRPGLLIICILKSKSFTFSNAPDITLKPSISIMPVAEFVAAKVSAVLFVTLTSIIYFAVAFDVNE